MLYIVKNMDLKVKKLVSNAKLPDYGSIYAAGLDLYSSNTETLIVPPLSRNVIPTGISLEWTDKDYYIRIAPRSGLSVKNSIDIGAGVIDWDYRGEIKIVVINNHKENIFEVLPNMKIAQMIPTKIEKMNIIDCSELAETSRGSAGFGSTGI